MAHRNDAFIVVATGAAGLDVTSSLDISGALAALSKRWNGLGGNGHERECGQLYLRSQKGDSITALKHETKANRFNVQVERAACLLLGSMTQKMYGDNW
jgi:hypothetical protein